MRKVYYVTCSKCGKSIKITKEEYYERKLKDAQQNLENIKEEIRKEIEND